MANVDFGLAFSAGVASFLSPCVLPLVPGYVSYMSGLSLDELARDEGLARRARTAGLGSIAFVAGFSAVFTALGATASAVGVFLETYRTQLSLVAGVVVVLFGLHTIGILPIKWLYYEKRFRTAGVAPGLAGAALMGMAFAFGWTPCIGPILGGILFLACQQETVPRGMSLLFVYSMGLGIPFILTGFGTAAFIQFFNLYKRYIRWGEVFAGLLLVAVGVLIASNKMTALIPLFPGWLRQFAR